MQIHRRLLALFALGIATGGFAAEPASKKVPPPPPIPAAKSTPSELADDPGALEPEVTITSREGAKFEEYRVNGHLYKVKVTPKHGAPYYLLYDEQGNQRRSDLEPNIAIPQWVIKRF